MLVLAGGVGVRWLWHGCTGRGGNAVDYNNIIILLWQNCTGNSAGVVENVSDRQTPTANWRPGHINAL